jgi:hypothetical protein
MTPADAAAPPALLWATGRLELPAHPRRARWRWYSEPSPRYAPAPAVDGLVPTAPRLPARRVGTGP